MGFNRELFLTKSTNRLLLKFAVPGMISLLVTELYNMVDTIYVGRTIGGSAIGGLTIAFPIQRLIIAVGMMIAIGAYTSTSRSLGENNNKKIKSVIINSMGLIIIIISFLILIIYLFQDSIIKRLGASQTIFPYAKDYISIVILGGIFQCLAIVMCYIMTALGNSQINLKATSLGALLNIFLDYILVVVYPFGVKGAAISTVISQFVSFIYAWIIFRNIIRNLKIKPTLELEGDTSLNIMGVGFSTFIIEISDAVVAAILNNLLFAYGGDNALIIVGVTTKVSMFLFITVLGISSAMQPIASFNYGAEDYEKVREVVTKTIKFVTISSAAVWLGMMLFPGTIMGFFLMDGEILLKTVNIFRIIIGVFPVVGLYYVAIYYYQAMGEGRVSFFLSIYRQIIIFIPLLLIFVKLFGLIGVWISYPVSDIISAITGAFYLNRSPKLVENMEVLETV